MSIFAGVGNRGGNRGGKDQFNWDDVRGDRYKEYYLGQSLKIGPGNSGWWIKKDSLKVNKTNLDKKVVEKEDLQKIKQQEQELMMEALGIIPKRKRGNSKKLQKHELKELVKRGNIERDETDINRISGIGFEPMMNNEEQEESLELESLPSNQETNKEEDSEELFYVENKNNNGKIKENKKENKKEKKHKKEKKLKKKKKDKKRKHYSSSEDDNKKKMYGVYGEEEHKSHSQNKHKHHK